MEFPVGPVIQVAVALLGLIILISLALGWRGARQEPEAPSTAFGEDRNEVSDRSRAARNHDPGSPR